MQFEQDFIMRQVRYLTQLLQQIIFKKDNNKQHEAIQEIDRAFERITKDNPQKIHELSLQKTLGIFSHQQTFQSDLALAVADLMMEEAKMLGDNQYSKSQKAYQQALLLYKKAKNADSSAVPINIAEKISAAEKNIADADQLDLINRMVHNDD